MGDRVSSEKSSTFVHRRIEDIHNVDVAASVDLQGVPLDPQVATKLRQKIDYHLMPLMCIVYLMAFADKVTLGQSAVLGIIPGAHLTQNQFNWLGTVFYLSYLVFEYPQNLALQKFPVGKWISINIFIWSIAMLAHAACKSFGALLAVRIVLGMCEAVITSGFVIVTSMFYTRAEQNKRTGYWFLMNGVAIIFLGFVSYGVLHTKTHNFMPWQWLMVITGLITFITSVLFWFFFPDSPMTAKFLTSEERIQAIQRIKANQTGIENKHWKREQFVETLRDPKVWVMALFTALVSVMNSLTNQRQIIINQFGFTLLQTTLLGCVDGVVEILTILIGVNLASWKGVGRGYATALMLLLALLGSILVNTLPTHNKVGLLFSYWITLSGFTPFVILLGWIGSIVSGHTKRTTANAVILIAYGVGNAAGPFMWKRRYQPRNHIPWAVISSCIFACLLLVLLLRFMLDRENKRRESEKRTTEVGADDDTTEAVFIVQNMADGTRLEKRVDRVFLDLTDIQNREFRYAL